MTLAADLSARRRAGAMESIAAVAMELFERDGFSATAVEAIASAAGCSNRTFYRYFGTKEDVMFYDRAESLQELRRVLREHLDSGLGIWDAVVETYTNLIGRFDDSDPDLPTRRMRLCLSESALWTPYLGFVYEAEQVVADELHRHRGSIAATDDYPQLVAVAATGAYRVTLFTHMPVGDGRDLKEHLRAALAVLGTGLDTRQPSR